MGTHCIFRRAICCRKRSRRNSGMILPVTVDKKNDPDYNNKSGLYYDYSAIPNPNNFAQQNYFQSNQSRVGYMSKEQNAEIEEPDYFKDMTPEFKRQKKIILAINGDNGSAKKSNRLDVDIKAPIVTGAELGAIDDSYIAGSWEDNEELCDPDETLRDLRQAEREKRIAEHKRIKLEKELKKNKNQKTSIATKIS